VVVFAGLGVTIMSLVVDVLYAFLDPRVKYA
jgi:ABC-type dipeptide/oligopeptide/nickel transport system permease component